MNAIPEADLGWYHIDDVWNLYVDGALTKVHVDYICVDESPDGSDSPYHVDHYGRDGTLITSLRMDADDIFPEIRNREPVGRPWHL